MPHFISFDNIANKPDRAVTSYIEETFGDGNGKHEYRADFDVNDFALQPSNQFAGKAVVHPEFHPEADGFMKLGDIKGEVVSTDRDDSPTGQDLSIDDLKDVNAGLRGQGSSGDTVKSGNGTDLIDSQDFDERLAATDFDSNDSAFKMNTGYPVADRDCLTNPATTETMGRNDGKVESLVKTYCTGYDFDGGTDLRSDNRFVFEPLQAMTSLSESPVLKEPSNWDAICDVGTSIKQANVMPNFAIVYNNNG